MASRLTRFLFAKLDLILMVVGTLIVATVLVQADVIDYLNMIADNYSR